MAIGDHAPMQMAIDMRRQNGKTASSTDRKDVFVLCL